MDGWCCGNEGRRMWGVVVMLVFFTLVGIRIDGWMMMMQIPQLVFFSFSPFL